MMRNHHLFSQLGSSRANRAEVAEGRWQQLQQEATKFSNNHKSLVERVRNGGSVALPLKVKGGQDGGIARVLAAETAREERSPLQRFYAAGLVVAVGRGSEVIGLFSRSLPISFFALALFTHPTTGGIQGHHCTRQ